LIPQKLAQVHFEAPTYPIRTGGSRHASWWSDCHRSCTGRRGMGRNKSARTRWR